MSDGTPAELSGGQFIDRNRHLLRTLRRLAAERVSAAEEVDRTHAELGAAATERHESKRADLKSTFAEDSRIEGASYRVGGQGIRRSARDATRKVERARDDEHANITERADRNEGEARKRLDEAVWATETVYEANQDRPRLTLKEVEGELTEQRNELLKMAEDARVLLRRYRQKIPASPAADTAPDADAATTPESPADATHTAELAAETLERESETARAQLAVLGRLGLAGLFRGVRLPVLVVLLAGGAGTLTAWRRAWVVDDMLAIAAGGTLVGLCLVAFGLYFVARRQCRTQYRPLAAAVRRGLEVCDRWQHAAEQVCETEEAELVRQRDEDVRLAREKYEPILDQMQQRRLVHLKRIEDKYPAELEAISERGRAELEELEAKHVTRKAEIKHAFESGSAAADHEYAAVMEEREARHEREWIAMEAAWKDGMAWCEQAIDGIVREDVALFPEWDDPSWTDWIPPRVFAPSIRFGKIDVRLDAIPGAQPEDERLAVSVPARFTIPATLDLPDKCSLLLLAGSEGRDAAVNAVKAIMTRLLTALPPGKVRFTIFDPVGLGQSFAGFMHLADYEDSFVTGRIWTETRHIEQRLADLSEHMETVIQKYLRNEFETIAQYNEHAGEIAEPYRFLVVSDFPASFSETAARRLASIVNSGARCGVHTLIIRDVRQDVPRGLEAEDLEANAIVLEHKDGRFHMVDEDFAGVPLTLETAAEEEFLTQKLHLVGEASKDATRVEVPFSVIAPKPGAYWTRETPTQIAVPLGRCGATKLQELIIGPGTAQHALIAGKTGSGKSTLLHVLITNLALWYSPREVQFYLVDFKKGVEFKTYATHGLPHARAVAVESDREFGLSVLQRIDQELKRRGDRFRTLGVQDLGAFRRAAPDESMPRTLLLVDEFQEMFVEDDKLGQDAALILDRLVRQGRAFGIHVILGSQTLGGAYTLARSTMGQMQVRIALQCSEADSYLIMSDDNSAARLLGRPGEAIYNDAGGAVEGNSPFQIVWLPDAERERRLKEIEALAIETGYVRDEPLIVFEGNVPADVRTNHLLAAALEGSAGAGPERVRAPHVWLGEAIAIKGPTAGTLRRQSGNNILLVGQQEESALAMMTTALISLAAQTPVGDEGARFYILDGSPVDATHADFLERVAGTLPHDIRVVKWRNVETAMHEIGQLLRERAQSETSDTPSIFLLIYGLHRFRMLRAAEDFSFSASEDEGPRAAEKEFGDILRDGAPLGIHTMAWCDTVTNLNRTLDRNGLREFEMRVLFQMSGADSTQLIDTPVGAKLGLRRAFYYNEEEGLLEKFRPYALPDAKWLEEVSKQMARASGAEA